MMAIRMMSKSPVVTLTPGEMANSSKVLEDLREMAVIDYVLVEPSTTLPELALKFGYTLSAIVRVFARKDFVDRLYKRRAQLTTPSMEKMIKERTERVLESSFIIVEEKLNKNRGNVALALAVLKATTREYR